MIRRKIYEVSDFKALPDQDGTRGRFTAIVSVFGNVDLQGDRVVKGAFTKSLERWKASGDPLPIIWSHAWLDPDAHIGMADPKLARETEVGLEITGQLDIEHPFAAQVYKLLQQRRVKQWSFAYDIEDERPGRDGANDLVQLHIIEAGPTLAGANPETDTLAVKSLEHAAKAAGAKAGRALSAKHEADLRQAHELIGRVLGSVATADEEKDEPDGKATDPPIDASKMHGAITGSHEERRGRLSDAVDAWAVGAIPGFPERGWAWIVATFDDAIVVEVDTASEPERHYRIPYTLDAEGAVTLGEPEEVEVDVRLVAKLREAAAKAAGRKQVDDAEWDGPAALSKAAEADDPEAALAAIAFRRDNDSDPATAAAWALPHHRAPGEDPNATGVSAALGALSGARGGAPALADPEGALEHLEAHRRAIEGERQEAGKAKASSTPEDVRRRLETMTAGLGIG